MAGFLRGRVTPERVAGAVSRLVSCPCTAASRRRDLLERAGITHNKGWNMSYIEGGPENDHILGDSGPDTLLGGKGNDMLFGNDGDDHLFGNQGRDWLDGGQGSDTYHFALGDGHDSILAGPGLPGQPDRLKLTSGIAMTDVDASQEGSNLLLRIRGRDDSVRIVNYFNVPEPDRITIFFDQGGQWGSGEVLRKIWLGDDTLHGTPDDDVLDGGAGRDALFGHEGRDTLYGDAGNDWLNGEAGHDTYLFGKGDGHDTVVAGWDSLSSDRLVLGAGIGVADIDVRESSGDLLLSVHGGRDSVRIAGYFNLPEEERLSIQFADGGLWDGATVLRKLYPSQDNLHGIPQGGLLDGGLGDDWLQGLGGDDTLYGDGGNDRMDGGDGADTLVFGRGDGQDTVFARPEGPRHDRVLFGADIGMTDVVVSAEAGDLLLRVHGTSDVLRIAGYFHVFEPDRTSIQFANGGQWDSVAIQRKLERADDHLIGTPDNDLLDGGLGKDMLIGGEGNDTLYGDAGNDWLDGGQNSDTYLFGRDDGQDTVMAGPGDDPGQGDRVLLGAGITLADVDVSEQFGDLLLQIRGGRDSLRVAGYFGLNEPDRPVVEFADGSRWDALTVLRKLTTFANHLTGTPNDELLDGGQGHDMLFAGDGSDTLYGDAGNDWLHGEQGADTYVFGRGDGRDTVVAGYGEPNQVDRLLLGAGIGMADVDLSERFGDLVVSVRDSTDSVTIANYFAPYGPQRLGIEFADGTRWDGITVERKLFTSDEALHGSPANDLLDGGLGRDVLAGA
jgi:Ca2+-binding RTX toxin-like protein